MNPIESAALGPHYDAVPVRADLEAIDRAMQHMGDALNEMDAADEEGENITAPGFEAIARLLEAPAAQPEQAKPTDWQMVRMTLECGDAKQVMLLSRSAMALSKVKMIGLHAERMLDSIERHLTAPHGESDKTVGSDHA